MVQEIRIKGKVYTASQTGMEFFTGDAVRHSNLLISLDIMRNCLDTIYRLVHRCYPKAVMPDLLVTDSEEVNACAIGNKYIIIHSGLIFKATEFIEQRYSEKLLKKYGILTNHTTDEVKSGIRVYLWRYVILHELYHIWNGHALWNSMYYFDATGNIKQKSAADDIVNIVLAEQSISSQKTVPKLKRQDYITSQAMEIDADSSAVCMLVNLLMYDADSQKVLDRANYIKDEMALIMGALSTAYCLFDNNSGAKFEMLKSDLELMEHPIPSIRMLYAEEIADGVLNQYIPESNDLLEAEIEWKKIVCDVEPEFKGQVDMGQVFYYTGYTEKAQRHLCMLKHRLNDMYDTLKPLALANTAPKMEEDEMCFIPESVWFDEDGRSLKGWVNPATGQPYAIKAKPKPIRKAVNIGRNAPCPCGSGLKWKKCSCEEYHDK